MPNLKVKTISLKNNMDDWVDLSVLVSIQSLRGKNLVFVREGTAGIRAIMIMMEMIRMNFR